MTARFFRRILTAEAIGWILVFLALQTFTYGISESLRGTETDYFFPIGLVAALICLGLVKARWNGIQASAGMAALGVLGVWILGARLWSPLIDLGQAIVAVIPQIIPAIRERAGIDTTAIAEAWTVIAQASAALSLRLQTWFFGLNRNITINDALIRSMAWALIVWLFAACMGWFAGRRNAVAALLPSILLLAAVTSYSGRKLETLWLMALILLLLMGVWNFKNHAAQWEKRKVDYSDSIRYDVGEAVIMVAITIGALAFVTPSVSWRDIQEYFRERNQRNEAAEMLGIQQQPAGAGAAAPQPSLPREHLLDSSYSQSQKVVMTIRTGELPPIFDPSFIAAPSRYYWRSITYDSYVGAGWVTSYSFPETYNADTPLIPGLLDGYRLVHLDVRMIEPEGTLFWSGILFSADVPITAGWRVRPQSNLFADRSALLSADMYAALTNASAYKADVYVPIADINKLRSAGTDYPEYIRERYLTLPRSVPARVRGLASEITDGITNPYDKAKAIERYLREHYEYDLEVPPPPEGADVADYFLFELQRGYCDYYATAMVVLARASGVPARFVSGYAPGSYDAPNAQYVVRELNAHSWAEVYFPQVGWIEFEPTAALPEIERSSTEVVPSPAQDTDITAVQLLNRFRFGRILYWASPFIGTTMLLFIYFTWIERWWYLQHLAPEASIEWMTRGLYRLARPFAGERTSAETAHEFMNKVVRRFEELKARSRLAKAHTRTQRDVMLLTDLYQASLFSRHHTQKEHARLALKTWKRLRWKLLFSRLFMSSRNRVVE